MHLTGLGRPAYLAAVLAAPLGKSLANFKEEANSVWPSFLMRAMSERMAGVVAYSS